MFCSRNVIAVQTSRGLNFQNANAQTSDGSEIQIEHVFRRYFFDKRLYVAGFADHIIDKDGSSTWVDEAQFGLRLADQLHAVAEYRYKSFNSDGLKSGWGFGFQYLIKFN